MRVFLYRLWNSLITKLNLIVHANQPETCSTANIPILYKLKLFRYFDSSVKGKLPVCAYLWVFIEVYRLIAYSDPVICFIKTLWFLKYAYHPQDSFQETKFRDNSKGSLYL